jgi:fatty-acyl-CoA synthase
MHAMAVSISSYLHGVDAHPLVGLTVSEFFDQAVQRNPLGEALVVPHQSIRWNWQQLSDEVDGLAAGLYALGLRAGERIGILSPNTAQWIVTQFASARLGAVLVNINPAYRPRELHFALDKTACKVLVTASRFKSSDYLAMLTELVPELGNEMGVQLQSAHLPALRHVIVLGEGALPGAHRYQNVLRKNDPTLVERLDDQQRQLQFDDPINIQFTSGTTGTPKAATLSHHNIVNNAILVARTMELGSDDRLCIPVPMYHCFGMVLGALCCVAAGATMVLPSEGFDAGAVLRAISEEGCTALHGVPTMFIAELEHEDFARSDLSSLRTGIIAGAPCSVDLMNRLVDEMHLEQITIAYGMTETGPASFQTSVHDSLERRVTTVGRVLPHTEVKIVDTDNRVLPVGESGELLIRGYCVMTGYWDDTDKTAEAIDAARWIRSGDIAVLDEHGYCQIVGRIKDMLIRGGENIYPREIEDFLVTHPKVNDVQVVGVPDQHFGEEICACIRLRHGQSASAEEIREFCKGHIAHFKIPRYVVFVDDFPMTVTGKVQKFKLREAMAHELDLEGVA